MNRAGVAPRSFRPEEAEIVEGEDLAILDVLDGPFISKGVMLLPKA